MHQQDLRPAPAIKKYPRTKLRTRHRRLLAKRYDRKPFSHTGLGPMKLPSMAYRARLARYSLNIDTALMQDTRDEPAHDCTFKGP